LEGAGRDVYKLLTARQAVGENIGGGDYQAKVDSSDRLYYEKALELSQLLFGQVQEQLGGKRLIIVSEGILQYIPVDALPAPLPNTVGATSIGAGAAIAAGQPLLIATHEIVTLPSISTLAAIRNKKHEVGPSERVVAVLADPVFSASDDRVENGIQSSVIASKSDQVSSQPSVRGLEGASRRGSPIRLAHAAEEADAILAAAPRGAGMLASGFEASRETAMGSRVAEYRILHFATHGFLNTDHPELSGIVLSMVNRNGSKTNGFMSLQDIYNLDLSADVVVLSACDTALGKDVKGEGLVGLTHGFMAAGARSVVASLWKVDDRATAVLMANFYKAMLQDGLTPVAALRFAKQKVRQEKAWQAPYFWAGFELQGEYNQRIVVARGSAMSAGMGTVLTLALALGGLTIYRRRRRSYLTRQ
jgi:CHAT domain-containing protein